MNGMTNKENRNKAIKDLIKQREDLKNKPIPVIDNSPEEIQRRSTWRVKK